MAQDETNPYAADPAAEDPARIREEIRETRARVGETLEQLGERLNPRVLKAQVTSEVKQGIRDATIGKVETMTRKAGERIQAGNSSLMDRIRDNPVPAAMIAIGIGWLLMSKKSRPAVDSFDEESTYDYSADDYTAFEGGYAATGSAPRVETVSTYAYRTDDELVDDLGHGVHAHGGASQGIGAKASHAADRAREAAGHAADRAKDVAGQAADRVKQAAGSAQERARSLAGTASVKARGIAGSVKQGVSAGAQRTGVVARDTARRTKETYDESPLALGAVAMALGVAAGLAVPVSDREVRLMGDARDQVVDRVRGMARETVDKVETVAERVFDETRDSVKTAAREEGLVS